MEKYYYGCDLFATYPNSKCVLSYSDMDVYTADYNSEVILWVDKRKSFGHLEATIDHFFIRSKKLVILYIFDSYRDRKRFLKKVKGEKNGN